MHRFIWIDKYILRLKFGIIIFKICNPRNVEQIMPLNNIIYLIVLFKLIERY